MEIYMRKLGDVGRRHSNFQINPLERGFESSTINCLALCTLFVLARFGTVSRDTQNLGS